MQRIAAIAREVWGLFVDDGSFALAILLWVVLVWIAFLRMGASLPGGLILFAGLAAILLWSVLRASRKALTRPHV